MRDAMGPVAASYWGHPSSLLQVVGVTGTSGKTTTTHLLGAIANAAGRPAEVIGTLSGPRTTPEATDLQASLAAALAAGRTTVAMEVSSHALALGRVRATRFAVAVFTNLSHDHLDFHRDLEDYFAAKARLFRPDLALERRGQPRRPVRRAAGRRPRRADRGILAWTMPATSRWARTAAGSAGAASTSCSRSAAGST